MTATLEVVVKPKIKLTQATQPTQRLFARFSYTSQIKEEAARQPLLVPATISVELANDGSASFTVDDGAGDSEAEIYLETAQGADLAVATGKFPAEGKTGQFTFDVPVETYRAGGPRTNPDELPLLSRQGRFTSFADSLPDFGRYRLYVAPVRPAQAAGGASNPQTAAARALLGLRGNGDIKDFEVTELDRAKADPAAANALGLRDVPVRPDGRFDFALPVNGDEIGWFWILIGPVSYTGYQVDSASGPSDRYMTIILPPAAATVGERGGTSNGVPTGPQGSSTNPPLDFDEQQVIDNPGLFNDDPGSACSPFSNPQRVLGERPFFTVLRVDQPEIGGEGSVKISRPIVLDLAPPIRASAIAATFAGETDITGRGASAAASNARLSRSLRIAVGTEAEAARAGEAREILEANVSKPISTFWNHWIRTKTRKRDFVSPRNPIEWEGNATLYQAGSVAGGHILEHRVQWRSNGYSLGDVAHTLTLAPRQSRRISKISWRRRERASRTESTSVTDRVSQTTERDRDYNDAVQSNLAEWSKGGSSSSTTGAAGGIGFALGPVVIGGGAAHGQASSSSWQNGGRRVEASEHQSLRDAIRQFGDSLRRLESTVVTELSQEEEVEGISETVRNVNYCHALTVMYHEILRHYRVDTTFAGVRECLFVPFSITPFDVNKALKWRDKLRGGMLARDLRWALDRLDEVANAWVDSDIPAGRRSAHPISYISGSAYIKLSIERPRDREDEEAIEAYRALWTRLAPLMGTSVSAVMGQLERTDRDRDAYYQREVAPGMAARWADRLKFIVGGAGIDAADFTLASTYRYGGTVRVDFTIPINGGFNRENLQAVTIKSDDALPAGSTADLTRVQMRYFTDHFDATAESVATTNDLIRPIAGEPDPDGADVRFPLTAWERQDLRRVIEDAVDLLIVHLNANLVYYHKVIWWLMDRDELFMLLDGFIAPYGRRFENGAWVEDTGRSVASVIEREPLGILGNSLVFRVAGGVFLGIDGHESPADLHSYYHDGEFRPQPLRVSLPTDGLYAQALMDKCEACEEHFGSTDWVLSDKDPELEALADQFGTRRAAPDGTTPSQMPETLINLQNAPAAPDPTGLGGILSAVANSGAFRDMAGLAGTQANALGALTQASTLASSFGQMAVDFQKSKQGTADAKQKLSNIAKAKAEGLIDDAEAKRLTTKALDEQNMSPPPKPLTETTPIESALQKAGATGQPIEVTRQGAQGVETVKVGAFEGDLIPAVFTGGGPSKAGSKLPPRTGTQPAQAWEALAPITPRVAGTCAGGLKNLGTLLIVHDAETEIDLRDYGGYTNADTWVLVHTVSDLIEAVRAHVGSCGYLTGIHIEAHGGWSGSGGFRMGDDTDGDGHVEGTEANDMVSSAAQATKFGTILKSALGTGGTSYIAVAACNSSGTNDAFLKALQTASGAISIGSVDASRSGGNWFHGAWWEVDKGRSQVNIDGTTKVDTRDEGTGIWRPF
ncbi:hypothetical protein [Ferirhizobium litorale]|uniref:Tellurite resistance TerB family protein n=1 Tax=Ferirhizobium litorale TaxID=2927786 RepID=A0AAE3QJR5_9HYPH|nr:hypothetical protein [Fererhizobium litorale]MDI7924621.1 tellurite resistance TerB family protein [Fererhizobium litorale]